MADPSVRQPDDERLRQLLAVEQRLQDLVRAAHEDASRRLAAARALAEQRLAAAREAAKLADHTRAEAEQVSHAAALATIQMAHKATLARMAALAEPRVDELARWAVAQAIGGNGEVA